MMLLALLTFMLLLYLVNAVSERVFAYTYEPKEEFKASDAVCLGPDGIVSAILDYKIWGAGKIKVDNRIWIKI